MADRPLTNHLLDDGIGVMHRFWNIYSSYKHQAKSWKLEVYGLQVGLNMYYSFILNKA